MILYSFMTEDGEEIERRFPMGECPKEITLDDGRTAKRVFGTPHIGLFGGGHASGDAARKLNADMRKRQADAGRRMKDSWESVKSQK